MDDIILNAVDHFQHFLGAGAESGTKLSRLPVLVFVAVVLNTFRRPCILALTVIRGAQETVKCLLSQRHEVNDMLNI